MSRGGGVEPDFSKLVFPGLNRMGFGSGWTYATWISHLGTELGLARLRDAGSAARRFCPAVTAALRDCARRRT